MNTAQLGGLSPLAHAVPVDDLFLLELERNDAGIWHYCLLTVQIEAYAERADEDEPPREDHEMPEE